MNRISRQPKKLFLGWWGARAPPGSGRRPATTRTKHHRPPRLNLRSGEIKLRLQFAENQLYQIVLSHGDATSQQQQVAIQSFFDQRFHPLPLIRPNCQPHRLPARIPPLRRQRIRIRIPYLRRPRRRINLHHFVTGRKHGHAWLPEDLDPALTYRRRNRDAGMVKPPSSIQQQLPCASLRPAWNKILADAEAAPNL